MNEVLGGAESVGYSAAVCAAGHVVAAAVENRVDPLPQQCPDCGAAVLTACASCGARIPGEASLGYTPPPVCTCGQQFPWSTPESLVARARAQLSAQPGLTPNDQALIGQHVDRLADPATPASEHPGILAALKDIAPTTWGMTRDTLSFLLPREDLHEMGIWDD